MLRAVVVVVCSIDPSVKQIRFTSTIDASFEELAGNTGNPANCFGLCIELFNGSKLLEANPSLCKQMLQDDDRRIIPRTQDKRI